jgi:hypothetical protein
MFRNSVLRARTDRIGACKMLAPIVRGW